MINPTAETALLVLQTALYERLAADQTLAGMVQGVFDHVPEPVAYPYVVVGEAVETPRNHHGGYGREVLATLHVWSAYRGFAEALRIAARLVELLDHRDLAAAGHATVAVRHEQTLTLRDPDPKIRHVPVSFRVVTEQQ